MPAEIDLTDSASLPEGELRAFPVPNEGPEVLLARYKGQVHAFAAHCPHYGAPLAKGKLLEGRIICPWHHACFQVADGTLCEPPALDDLPAFAARETDGRIWVQVPASPAASLADPNATPTAEVGGTPPPAAETTSDTRTFVIVGGGAAGEFAAQTLRQEGFAGRIVLASADAAAPYDRTKLSKAYLAGKAQPAALPLRSAGFYAAQRIEVLTDARATGLDLARREVHLAGRPPIAYDQLLLAPGSTPNQLPSLPGHDLAGVLTLRTQADADALLAATNEAQQVVIIGSSFIGMEAASSLISAVRQVTVVAQEKVPFERVLGAEIGAMFQAMHEAKGVKFEGQAEVTELLGNHGTVSGVRLKSGQVLPATVVVLGVGVRPATEFLQAAFPLAPDGGLAVDEYLQAAPGVYAAGDIARFPLALTGQPARIEHWRLAQQHGRVAARNMLGKEEKYVAAPFFWTQQYGKSLRYAGHAEHWDQLIYHGDVAQQDFVAFYVQGGRIVAAAGMGRDADLLYITERLGQGTMPAPDALREGYDWAQQA